MVYADPYATSLSQTNRKEPLFGLGKSFSFSPRFVLLSFQGYRTWAFSWLRASSFQITWINYGYSVSPFPSLSVASLFFFSRERTFVLFFLSYKAFGFGVRPHTSSQMWIGA